MCLLITQESRAAARKPRDAASVLFGRRSPTTFLTSIRLAMLRNSKATLQSSKHAGAKHNLKQNQESKSFKVTRLESVESSEALINQNVDFNCQGFDFRRHSIFPWISNIQRITCPILRFPPVTRSDLYLETI